MKFIILILLISCVGVAQNTSNVVRIEFTSLTRGYQESVIITSDSIKISRTQTREEKIDQSRVLKEGEWTELLKAVQKIQLTEIPDLKSPSMKRTYDGARHSTITLTTNSNQVYSHSFDDENPNEKLMGLMKVIQKKRKF